MHIAIDGRTIKHNPSGVGLWNLQLIKHLLTYPQVDHISLILSRNCSYDFQTDSEISVHVGSRIKLYPVAPQYNFVDIRRFVFEEFNLGSIVNAIHPDIYHATDSFGIPHSLLPSIKTVLTIHDLIPLTPYREYLNVIQLSIYKLSLRFSLKRARSIVSISPKTDTDLHSFFPALPATAIIPDGILTSKAATQHTSQNTRGDYTLYFGGFGPRKNAETVVRVFSDLRRLRVVSQDAKLILSGRIKHAKNANNAIVLSLQQLIKTLQLENSILIMDYMSPQEKTDLITHARLVLFFSLYEGFGLPPCEVLQIGGTPLFSRTGIWYSYSSPSPLIVEDPMSTQEIVSKYQYAITHGAEIQKEKQKLNDFLRPFTWQTMAERYIKLYTDLMQ